MLDSLLKDVRYAARSLRRSPGFAATAVLTLALGIGANSAIFSLVNAVVLRTLPVNAPEELVFVGSRDPRQPDAGVTLLSNPAWLQRIRQETTLFTGVAGYNIRDFKLSTADGAELVVGQFATGNYHALIGVPMALGRGFATENDFAGSASAIAVISDRYWQRRFNRSPEAIGAPLVVGGHAVTIVGVTAAGFDGLQPGRQIEITLPLSIRVQDEDDFVSSLDSWTGMPLVARLRPGVTAAAAEPIVDAAYRDHMTQPGIGFGRDRNRNFVLQAAVVPAARGADRLRREYEPALNVLMTIVAVVLLIGCVNLANLFLARGAARADEVAMRLAIGASRWRLVRQLLAEASLVAVVGAVIGFAGAAWATQYISALLRETSRPIVIDAQPDLRVLAFTFALAALTTLLFGLAPALRATRRDVSLRATPLATVTVRRSPARVALIATQLALCVVLVLWAGLLVRTVNNFHRVDGRFATDAVVAFAIDANDTAFPERDMVPLCTTALERLREPGVLASACAVMTPLDTAAEIRVLGLPEMPAGGNRDIWSNAVSPGYFAVFGLDLVRGRLLAADDTSTAPRVAVLNEAAARHFFPNQDPVGRQIAFGGRPDPKLAITVVGVVRDVRHNLRDVPRPMSFQPLTQVRPDDHIVAAIRTAGDATPIAARVRGVVRALSAEPAVPWVRTLREQMEAALVTERLLAGLSSAFGLLALLLAATGLFGVIAYDVAGRTREIGIRMALGADRRRVLAGVYRLVGVIVVPGLVAGVAASLLASKALETLLFGITPRDPATLTITAAVLAAVSFAAAYVPARRAARVNPVVALRSE